MFSTVVVASLCRSVGSMTRRGGSFGRPGSQPQVIDGRSGKSLSSSCRARIEAKGLSGGIGTLMFTVVVASLRRSVECVGCLSRRGGSFGRPGSQPQVIDGRSGVSLSSSCRARIEAKGLSGGIGTLMFSVVVASLRGSVGCVGCMSRRGCLIRRPGSQPQVIDGRSKASLTSSCGARIEAKGKTQKLAVHAAAGGDYSGEKRNVLIVSVLLHIGVDLTLRSNTQRAIEVLGVCEQTVLLHEAA